MTEPPIPAGQAVQATAAAPPAPAPAATPRPATVAVLDHGKSNIKLSACTEAGEVVETLSLPNPVLSGPPWRHHDLKAVNAWLFASLADLARRHPLAHVIASGHGVGAVLVSEDPDLNGDGLVLPMIDYEQEVPEGVNEAYLPQAGDFYDRGSALMAGAAHIARQLYWAETQEPERFAKARWVMGIPQYWAWRLSGVASAEISYLGAQSHLWNVVEKRPAPIVTKRGWTHLLPPLRPAGERLGPIRPTLAARHDLPATLAVHTGGHDSSLSFYRYQASGLENFAVLSTGTWIVALADRTAPEALHEDLGMTLNADVSGRPVGGALVMGGREYAAVAGAQPAEARADPAILADLIRRGTMALPMFSTDAGQYRGKAGQGRIIGPPPANQAERHALAVLYVALLAHDCCRILAPERLWVLDGSFLRDPAFAALLAALHGADRIRINFEPYGIAAGAALLCAADKAGAPLSLSPAPQLPDLPDLTDYARKWQALAKDQGNERD